jgi:hypothetical protein
VQDEQALGGGRERNRHARRGVWPALSPQRVIRRVVLLSLVVGRSVEVTPVQLDAIHGHGRSAWAGIEESAPRDPGHPRRRMVWRLFNIDVRGHAGDEDGIRSHRNGAWPAGTQRELAEDFAAPVHANELRCRAYGQTDSPVGQECTAAHHLHNAFSDSVRRLIGVGIALGTHMQQRDFCFDTYRLLVRAWRI